MPTGEDPIPDFDGLRERHERIMEHLIPYPEEGGGKSSSTTSALAPSSTQEERTFDFNDLSAATPSSYTTTATASSHSGQRWGRPLDRSLGIRPQFNLDSAERLLTTFRENMLPHYPVVMLPPGADVRALARDAPFVLLAVLAVTSYSAASPQGHGLYDDEFRKVLGLRFVASSERSLEMLEGLLIYCAW